MVVVWVGESLIVWGGDMCRDGCAKGALFDPGTESWKPMQTAGATPRSSASGIWTGEKLVVWGGWGHAGIGPFNSGDVYDPALDAWTALEQSGAPAPRRGHSALFVPPNLMVVWGGAGTSAFLSGGAILNLETGVWASIPTGGPTTVHASLAWTGTELIVWGGIDPETRAPSTSGALFDPRTGEWRPMSNTNAPGPQRGPSVWTGSEFIVWGGRDEQDHGGAYDPVTDRWRRVSTAGAPELNGGVALWTGTRVIAWGGDETCPRGGIYDPESDTWQPTTLVNARSQGTRFQAVWTDNEMLVFGGIVGDPGAFLYEGSRFQF